MDLFGFKRRKKEKKEKLEFLLRWQKTVAPNSPDWLVMTEKQLKDTTAKQALDDLRVTLDCERLCVATSDPDVFFKRLNLWLEKSKHIAILEKYGNFTFIHTANNRVMTDYNDIVKWFLIRYHTDVHGPASALKTKKGRLNRYQKWYDSLQGYYCYMNKEHIAYIETEYARHVLSNQ
jgi:hypothetical protein